MQPERIGCVASIYARHIAEAPFDQLCTNPTELKQRRTGTKSRARQAFVYIHLYDACHFKVQSEG